MIFSFIRKIKYDIKTDRIGPDCPFTHWRLYFSNLMMNLCKKKFKYFDDSAEFRAGAYAIVCSKISIGENVIVRPNCMFFADPRDGDEGSIVIEKDVMMGSGVHIYVANHRYDIPNKNLIEQGHSASKSVYLKEGCWLGANVVVLPGVTVGENAVVGSGSVVTKDIEPNTVNVGAPAKVIKRF